MTKKKAIFFAISLTLVLYSHYYGLFIVGAFFLFDFISFINKKINFKFIISYLVAGLMFLPWLIIFMLLKNDTTFLNPLNLTIKNFIEVLKFATLNVPLVYFLFLMATGIVVLRAIVTIPNQPLERKKEFLYFTFFVASVWITIVVLYLYGALFDVKYVLMGDRIMIPRYYTGLVPFAILVVAMVADYLLGYVAGLKIYMCSLSNIICATVSISFVLNLYLTAGVQGADVYNPNDQVRESAAWLRKQDIAYEPTTLLIQTDSKVQFNGFNEYYLTQKEQILPMNAVDVWSMEDLDISAYENIMLYSAWSEPNVQGIWQLRQLEENYTLVESVNSLHVKRYKRNW